MFHMAEPVVMLPSMALQGIDRKQEICDNASLSVVRSARMEA